MQTVFKHTRAISSTHVPTFLAEGTGLGDDTCGLLTLDFRARAWCRHARVTPPPTERTAQRPMLSPNYFLDSRLFRYRCFCQLF
ncbi:hypothetical protein TGPRC2_250685 [Toxoplasma gondii TgCatPRC2]|uniref:Uncharacterized protein n=4 Tax=Toxoplasma gondii TaxID=5811 RepID=S7V058_TOXGG|nr:hypothetical protein TGGT1_250685 [Toxoplasma gondii GT1]KAF4638786.1 hypothetical protein TGRH88_063950 [Toxoplasma gondii]KYK63994.1 hypothetical protein TGPRC2_250685 [Toxoplasma gondii TgCatPRC2]RQX70524.1 hypothetical protein TGCAST_250685 [Toxoplasma gondii CAST]